MHSPKRIKITDVNPHLICVLCGGYYVDATTIIECLHSFCKSCIVKYLEKNKYCPICDVQIHKTSPLLNIRSDKTLQNIVYKLVPSLFRNEMERRVDFYKNHPESLPQLPEDRGEVTEATPIFLPDEPMVICLEYQNTPPLQTTKRYLHCPATMTVSHLVKFIRGKYSLSPAHQVNVFFKEDPLMEDISLMDIAYTYQCRRKVPIHLTYRILEMKKKTIRIINFEPKTEVKDDKGGGGSGGEKEWKEVELQISENGVMSVRNLSGSESSPIPAVEAPAVYSPRQTSTMTISESSSDVAISGATKPQDTCELNLPIDRCPRPCAPAPKVSTEPHPYQNMNHLENHVSPVPPVPLTPSLSVELCPPSVTSTAPLLGSQTSIVTSSFPVMSTTSHPSSLHRTVTTEPIVSVCKVSRDQVRKSNSVLEANKLSISRVPPGGMKEKGDILNKIVSKLSPNERVIGNTSVTIRPVSPKMFPGLKPMEMQQNPSPPQMQQHHHQTPHHQHTLQKPQQKPILNKEAQQKPSSQGRYKTFAPTTKQWNPSIDRNTMLMKHNSELSKPSKFFRTRNNIPRFLGNPASGVKPMYAAPEEPPPMKQKLTLMKVESKNVPTSSMPRSPTKLPPPYTPGSPKLNKSFPDPKSFMGVTHRMPPSPAHTASFSPMVTNPYQLLYGGYGGPYAPDPRLLSPEVLRSMCAYHPSLPPSISMLFNPLHSLPRPPVQQEISGVVETSTPAVQRIPPSKTDVPPLPHPPKLPSEDKRSSPAVAAAADTSKQRSPSASTPPKEGPTPASKENIPSLLPLPSSLPLPPSAPPPSKDILSLPAAAPPEPVTHIECSSTLSSEVAEKKNSVEKPAVNHTDHSTETTKFDKPTNNVVTNNEIVNKNIEEGINLNNNIPKECTSPVPASTAPSLEEAVLSPK